MVQSYWRIHLTPARRATSSPHVTRATLGGVVFPTLAEGVVAIGFAIINPTGTGNFVGGTTALDDATVVPNAVYVNTVAPFFPQYSQI